MREEGWLLKVLAEAEERVQKRPDWKKPIELRQSSNEAATQNGSQDSTVDSQPAPLFRCD